MPQPRKNDETAKAEEVKEVVDTKVVDTKEAVAEAKEEPKAEAVAKTKTSKEVVDDKKADEPSSDKDAEIAELKEQLAKSKAETSEKDAVIKSQQEEIAKVSEDALASKSTTNVVDIAETANGGEKLYKAKFLKDHSFSMGLKDIHALKGQSKMVDIFTMNKLSARGIAVLVD